MNLIDGDRLRNMIIYGVYVLNNNRENLNSLNIFPVPDGDTGTNMSLTSIASLKELEKLHTGSHCDAVAAAVASGSLRGARGNSGVILSQLFRGISKSVKGKKTLTTADFADALTQSSETAYKAVMKPKEGTVLTVAREAAQIAVQAAQETEDFGEFLNIIIAHSQSILKQTTNMLPALKAAGVVDAGGKGLVHIYEGFLRGLTEQAPDISASGTRAESQHTPVALTTGEKITFRYCTEFIIDGANPTDKIMAELTSFLEGLGDSIVAVSDESIIKIHVHTNNPGTVLEHALKIGALSSVKIDNMEIQHTELITETPKGYAASFIQSDEANDNANKNIGVVAVSAGEGINAIFKELGCDVLIEGGQTMNPSAEDIVKAAEAIEKQNVIILPNNKNIILAAEQAARLIKSETGKEAVVLPTKSIPQGIGAMVAMVHEKPLSETADAMASGAEYVKTGQVTVAVRDTEIDGRTVKEGDYIGIIDGAVIASEKSALLAGKRIIETFAKDCELITVYYSDEANADEGNELCRLVAEHGLESEMYYGGQPVYTYVISAE